MDTNSATAENFVTFIPIKPRPKQQTGGEGAKLYLCPASDFTIFRDTFFDHLGFLGVYYSEIRPEVHRLRVSLLLSLYYTYYWCF